MAYETVNPATGECLRRFEEHSDADVTAALNAAHSSYRTWWQESFEGRARLVHRVADLTRERIEPLSALITLEMGKLPAESRGETALSADILSNPAYHEEFFGPIFPCVQGLRRGRGSGVGERHGVRPWCDNLQRGRGASETIGAQHRRRDGLHQSRRLDRAGASVRWRQELRLRARTWGARHPRVRQQEADSSEDATSSDL